MSSSPLERISASSVDGRAKTPRFIQNQLRKLHDGIIDNASPLRSAIQRDTSVSSAEADTEYLLALQYVKTKYLSLDVDKCIQEEYNLANGKDSPSQRDAVGIVYIKPTQYTVLYSVIAPLVSAIEAGNCVVLELGKTVSAVNDVLRKLLVTALDADTFAIVENRPNDQQFLDTCVQVLQSPVDGVQSSHKTLVSPNSRVVAIVDRTANIAAAAEALVKARFSFGGKSPYAPDLVLVNEFRVAEFSNAVLQQSTKYLAEPSNGYANGYANGHANGPTSQKRRSDQKSLVDVAKDDDACDVLVSGARASIINVKSRTSTLLNEKINEPLLVFNTITSLDDAIDFANSSESPLLALQTFAALPAAKYLAQFIEASVSFTNHIPVSLLVGPAAPKNYPFSPTERYTREMFTVPKPSYLTVPRETQVLDKYIDSSSSKDSAQIRKEALDKALSPLPPTGQHSGKAIGFFDQGLITGTMVFVAPVLVTAVGLTGWGLWAGIRRLSSR